MITPEKVAAVIDRVCLAKSRLGQAAATSSADAVNARQPDGRGGRMVHRYRCPFAARLGLSDHWHIGHTPTIEHLQEIADVVRFLIDPGPAALPAAILDRIRTTGGGSPDADA